MAKALQCPDCGARHRLDDVAHLRTFRCRECRRLLKVPAGVSPAPSRPAATASGATKVEERTEVQATTKVDGASKRTPPSQRGDAIVEQASKTTAVPSAAAPSRPEVPRLVRLLVWLLAIPAGLVPVLVAGRLAGVLTIDRAVDVFVGVGWGRFVPPLVMLPLWAAMSATVAHLAIGGIARARGRSA